MQQLSSSILDATSAPTGLSVQLRIQAGHAKDVFRNIELLHVMPYGKDIVALWNDEKTAKRTFYDVVTNLKSEHSRMIAMEYGTVESLYTLAILQEYRAKNVLEGSLSISLFVQNTLRSVEVALKSAQTTRDRFQNSAKEFAGVLETVERNILNIETKIAQMDKDIAKANQQLRDKIIALIADIIALSFATASVLVAFGFLGPGGATALGALTAKIGTVAAVTAAGIKTLIDGFSIADIVGLISAVESAQAALRKSLNELNAVMPRFSDVVEGVVELENFVRDMVDRLRNVANEAGTGSALAFDDADVESIKASWAVVKTETQLWMDVANIQGINPRNV